MFWHCQLLINLKRGNHIRRYSGPHGSIITSLHCFWLSDVLNSTISVNLQLLASTMSQSQFSETACRRCREQKVVHSSQLLTQLTTNVIIMLIQHSSNVLVKYHAVRDALDLVYLVRFRNLLTASCWLQLGSMPESGRQKHVHRRARMARHPTNNHHNQRTILSATQESKHSSQIRALALASITTFRNHCACSW